MTNRLAGETSPYLRQHADNPVDWYPWGEEAFARARAEDKPILLSVGYSSCHWCHVMAHESFEDPATAAMMNERFVNVKVDREERPDVDAVYMQAVQALTGHGGWPMTVFLTPEGLPFYGGTYYPPEDRQGMPSFQRVLKSVADAYTNRRDAIATSSEQLRQIYDVTGALASTKGSLTPHVFELANRNKRGIALDVTSSAGRAVFERLVRWADVYITNQLPRVRRKLRTEPDDLVKKTVDELWARCQLVPQNRLANPISQNLIPVRVRGERIDTPANLSSLGATASPSARSSC